MASFGQITFHIFLIGDEQAHDFCVVRDLGEEVYLHAGIYDYEGAAGDIPAWAEEEGVPVIRKEVTANLVPGPMFTPLDIPVGDLEDLTGQGRR